LTASPHLVPALIVDAGETAAWRYIEFFTANIRNPNTRRAYARTCNQFFAWCEDRGLTLTTIRPFDVAAYVETLQQTHSATAVKQQLAAVPLAHHRPGGAGKPGLGRTRSEACRENRPDAGARRPRLAQAARRHPD